MNLSVSCPLERPARESRFIIRLPRFVRSIYDNMMIDDMCVQAYAHILWIVIIIISYLSFVPSYLIGWLGTYVCVSYVEYHTAVYMWRRCSFVIITFSY